MQFFPLFLARNISVSVMDIHCPATMPGSNCLIPALKVTCISGLNEKRRFLNLPSAFQTSKGKEACIKEALSAHKEWIPDPTRYWIWLIDETEKLTRVWDFEDTCKEAGVKPLTVAQHLILEGKMVCNAIRMEGLKAYGSNIRMFVDPLFEDEFNFFGGKKQEVSNE